MIEIAYLDNAPHGVSFGELCVAVDAQILAGRDPSGIAFGQEGQLYTINRFGDVDVKESPD